MVDGACRWTSWPQPRGMALEVPESVPELPKSSGTPERVLLEVRAPTVTCVFSRGTVLCDPWGPSFTIRHCDCCCGCARRANSSGPEKPSSTRRLLRVRRHCTL